MADHADGEYVVDISCTEFARFDLASDATIWECVDRLTAMHGHVGVGVFRELEKVMGISWNSANILNDRPLRAHVKPASSTMYDSMHVFLTNGLCNHEFYLFLQAV